MPNSTKPTVIGRTSEKKLLDDVLASRDPELVAVYGRRRVGKTFLLREHLKDNLILEFAGLHNEQKAMQLASFHTALRKAFPAVALLQPKDWFEAFGLLRDVLERTTSTSKKRVILLDEFPWMATRKSSFLSAFENFWNTYGSRHQDLAIILCGSAAAWMIRNVVNARGGLYNRLTRRLRLDPFRLSEVEDYLNYRKIGWNHWQIASAYMAMGGIPHYLNLIRRGQSALQAINAQCFDEQGMLRNEYHNLYAALFETYDIHQTIVRVLATSWTGLTRDDIIAKGKLSSGGGVTKAIEELKLSDFVTETTPFDNKNKGSLLRLTDEFSIFYWNWMNTKTIASSWIKQAGGRRYESWCGYAFESLCLKHLDCIKSAIGIGDVETHAASWRFVPKADTQDEGAQIDLLLERADRCINICEIKFAEKPYVITKSYAESLERKLRVFHRRAGSRRVLFLTMITPNGIAPNRYSDLLVTNEVTLADLFQPRRR
jgi:uncharacterized protein